MFDEIKISDSFYYDLRKARGRINMTKEEYLKTQKEGYLKLGLNSDSTYVQKMEIDSVIRIVVHPNGYIPIALRKHFFLHSIKKKENPRCHPFWRPMNIIAGNDTLRFDDFELKFPLQLWPTVKHKEIDGMIVICEYK